MPAADQTQIETPIVRPGMEIAEVLRLRPAALCILVRHGLEPWGGLRESLAAVCRRQGSDPDAVAAEITGRPVAEGASHWEDLPLAVLVDYLVRDHRRFVARSLPEIADSIEAGFADPGDDARHLDLVASEFTAFSEQLLEHFHEEERFLFPKILRCEASLLSDKPDPDFQSGSLRVFFALRRLKNEPEFGARLRALLRPDRRDAPDSGPRPPRKRLHLGLTVLAGELDEHARLEREVLIPLAGRMELRLYDACIGGKPRPIAPFNSACLP